MVFSTHSLAFLNSLMISGIQSEVQGNGVGSVDAISFSEGEMGGGVALSRQPFKFLMTKF
jgi:hypothetical protein